MPKALSVSSFVMTTLCMIGWPAHALAAESMPVPVRPRTPIGKIKVGLGVPQDQYDVLTKDFAKLNAFDFSDLDPHLRSVLELRSGLSSAGAELVTWLEDRVHYLVCEDFNVADHLKSTVPYTAFENPGILPVLELGDSTTLPLAPSVLSSSKPETDPTYYRTAMTNIGSAIYLESKLEKKLMTVDIHGIGDVTVTSPRAGIMQIGEALFESQYEGEDADSRANHVLRMITFFHEARHSDGNGKSLTFLHSICPSGDLANLPACDSSLNGSYSVEAYLASSYLRSCKDCTPREKAEMRMMVLDGLSRVVTETVPPSATDPSNRDTQWLRFAYSQIADCENESAFGAILKEDCSNIDVTRQMVSDALKRHPDIVLSPAGYWDAKPEGRYSL